MSNHGDANVAYFLSSKMTKFLLKRLGTKADIQHSNQKMLPSHSCNTANRNQQLRTPALPRGTCSQCFDRQKALFNPYPTRLPSSQECQLYCRSQARPKRQKRKHGTPVSHPTLLLKTLPKIMWPHRRVPNTAMSNDGDPQAYFLNSKMIKSQLRRLQTNADVECANLNRPPLHACNNADNNLQP